MNVSVQVGSADEISDARAVRGVMGLTGSSRLHVTGATDAHRIGVVVLGSRLSAWFHHGAGETDLGVALVLLATMTHISAFLFSVFRVKIYNYA